MPSAHQGMWSRPISTNLSQAAAASRRCCKLLESTSSLSMNAIHHQRAMWSQHQLCHSSRSTVCAALPQLLQQQHHGHTQQLNWPYAPHNSTVQHAPQHAPQQWRQSQFDNSAALTRGHRCIATASTAAAAAAAAPEASPAPAATAVAKSGPAASKQAWSSRSNGSGSSSKPVGKGAQTLDYTTLVACCHELATNWVPAKVEEVVQPDKFTLALRLRTPLDHAWLHLSWHQAAARLCVGRPPARGDVSEAFTFAPQVSSHLKGLVLLSVSLPAPWERVAQLDFGARPGQPPSKRLYCEVMAKYSNVVLTQADGSILHCAYQVGGAMSSLRQVQQGRPYQLPPRAQGIAPDPSEPLDTWQANITQAAALAATSPHQQHNSSNTGRADPPADQATAAAAAAGGPSRGGVSKPQTLLSGATRAYLGVSPALVEELCVSAGVLPSAEPCSLAPETWQALYTAWQGWLSKLHSKSFSPCSCSSSNRFSVLGTYPEAAASVHGLLDQYYFSLQAGEVYGGLYQKLCGAVKQALKKAKGRVYSFEQQLASAGDAAAVQRQGDIIVANLYRITPGASVLEAEDWDTGKPVSIPLDPPTPPMDVAGRLFKRARKLRRAVDAVQPLLEAALQELDYLESVEQELSQVPPGGSEQELLALRQVQEELIESKVIKAPPEAALLAKGAAKGRKSAKRAQKGAAGGSAAAAAAAAAAGGGAAAPRQYVSPGGFTVLVGRNNKQNDVLSHQIAKPGDVWMHVRGMPGSHTVIKVSAGQQPEQQDMQFAADLAAWFSKGREAGKVDVIVTRAEHLKKFKGAKPGQVLLSKEEANIVARPASSVAAAAAANGGGQE